MRILSINLGRLQGIASALLLLPVFSLSAIVAADTADVLPHKGSDWHLSFQYLGLTWHPDGGSTPEVYPLKFDRKAYLVLSVGTALGIDYRLNKWLFVRCISAVYKDCAFLAAGCFHTGPRVQFSWRGNCINAGIGPILSFRQDWHRFAGYEDDEFYGDRVYKGWQYRLYWTALELEYLRRINDRIEFQYSIIPGAPLVITSMAGIRLNFDAFFGKKSGR